MRAWNPPQVYRILLALTAVVALGATPAPSTPLVVVFPLQTSAALDPAVNSQIVTALANQIALDNHLRVQSGDPSTPRADFLSTARQAGASFYVTGFLTPLGSGASIIEQVVSTQTGVVVYANTGQLFNMNDAMGQGDLVRNGIEARVSERGGFSSFAPVAPLPVGAGGANAGGGVAAPGPTTAPQANVGGLFGRKRAAPPAAVSPTPAAAPADSPAP